MRVRTLNSAPLRSARWVLYWSQMNRRVDSNHAMLFAIELANRERLPVLFYEGLTCSYPFANDRLHTFVLEAVPDIARHLRELGIGYCFYLRRRHADPNDVLYRLAADAAAVVTDDYPTFVARGHNASVPAKLDIAYYAVDSSCIVPMASFAKREYAAYTIRPKIRRVLSEFLRPAPAPRVDLRWSGPAPQWHTQVTPGDIATLVASCEIDHSVPPSIAFRGGADEARRRLHVFLRDGLRRYARLKNEPSAHATSELSPYLHFGQISSLEVALAVQECAREERLIADEFLEELIVRRELAFNFTRFTDNYDSLAALPDWALKTMREHAADRRDPVYTAEQLECAQTYDELWNATQRELVLRGKIHGYYRMYWGKKIIQWSAGYDEALATMIRLHDRYALDGRDPCTYANILWCFGLHDRPWTERPIFGTIRYMSYEGMKRKTDVDAYVREIAALERP